MRHKRGRGYVDVLAFVVFATYLLVGLSVYDDYGVSWDEQANHEIGTLNYEYVFEGKNDLLSYHSRDYGVAFELPATILEHILGLSDTRDIFLTRHLMTFLLYYVSLICFYLMARSHFNRGPMSVIAVFFLMYSPRIFAHSFYNPKDIPLMSFFIISFYTLTRYIRKPNLVNAVIHSIATALVINVRVVGLVVGLISVTAMAIANHASRIKKARGDYFLKIDDKTKAAIAIYVLLTPVLVFISWPHLWDAPVKNFLNAVKSSSSFRWDGSVLYLGKYVGASKLPWHYIPVWIAVTTPLHIILFFILGSGYTLRELSLENIDDNTKMENNLFLLWFFIPLVMVIVSNAVLYDAWRHLFFIYPAMVIICAKGICSFLKNGGKDKASSRTRLVLTTLIVSFFTFNSIYFIYEYHPHQNVYFNEVKLLYSQPMKHVFELDYWALSYRQALEHLDKIDRRERINILFQNGAQNLDILPERMRKKFIGVRNNEDADYFMTNFRYNRYGFPEYNEVYSIRVDGMRILTVYDLRNI